MSWRDKTQKYQGDFKALLDRLNASVLTAFDVETIAKPMTDLLSRGKVSVKVSEEEETGHLKVKLWHDQDIDLLWFFVGNYPACCAMMQMYGFGYMRGLQEDVVHEAMDVVFQQMLTDRMYFASKRLIVAMVDDAVYERLPRVPGSASRYEAFKANLLTDFPPAVEPQMRYSLFYSWFKKQQKCKSINVMFNANTANMVHLLEVICH